MLGRTNGAQSLALCARCKAVPTTTTGVPASTAARVPARASHHRDTHRDQHHVVGVNANGKTVPKIVKETRVPSPCFFSTAAATASFASYYAAAVATAFFAACRHSKDSRANDQRHSKDSRANDQRHSKDSRAKDQRVVVVVVFVNRDGKARAKKNEMSGPRKNETCAT